MSSHVSKATTLSEADVLAVLHALGSQIERELFNGCVVDLDYIGPLKLALKERRKQSERFGCSKRHQKFPHQFQPTPRIKRKLKIGIPTYREGTNRG